MQETLAVERPKVRRRAKETPREISRDGYHKLLATAKEMRKKEAYLFMRLFASTGMEIADVLALTVEAVKVNAIKTSKRTIHLPKSLQQELLDYALHNAVHSGQFFIDRTGKLFGASFIRSSIRDVSRAAGFDGQIACVSALQKLYERTRAEMETQVVGQMMAEQFEQEQVEHGWEN